MSALHPAYIVTGLAIGGVAALVALLVPWVHARHGIELGFAALAGIGVLVASQDYAAALLAVPAAGGLLGAAIATMTNRTGTWRARAPLAVLGVATAWTYLSVPDTEGTVLVASTLAASLAAWITPASRGPSRWVAFGLGALGGAVVAVALEGGGRWTLSGWIAPKLTLLVLLGVALLVERRLARRPPALTSEQGRPSQ